MIRKSNPLLKSNHLIRLIKPLLWSHINLSARLKNTNREVEEIHYSR